MTDQEIQDAFQNMSHEEFEKWIAQDNLLLIIDTRGLGLEDWAPPMYYAESNLLVAVRDRRSIYLGSST